MVDLLKATGQVDDSDILGLHEDFRRQAMNFRLMLANIQVLVDIEGPAGPLLRGPAEPSGIVRNIVARYKALARESSKEISWLAHPPEFGLVYIDGPAIDHVVTNLVDNALKFACKEVSIDLTKNPTHFFIRVGNDGPEIPIQYRAHLFNKGWTPEAAKQEERTSSGLGLYIGRTLARRYGGDLILEDSRVNPNTDHHTEFYLSLPLGNIGCPRWSVVGQWPGHAVLPYRQLQILHRFLPGQTTHRWKAPPPGRIARFWRFPGRWRRPDRRQTGV